MVVTPRLKDLDPTCPLPEKTVAPEATNERVEPGQLSAKVAFPTVIILEQPLSMGWVILDAGTKDGFMASITFTVVDAETVLPAASLNV